MYQVVRLVVVSWRVQGRSPGDIRYKTSSDDSFSSFTFQPPRLLSSPLFILLATLCSSFCPSLQAVLDTSYHSSLLPTPALAPRSISGVVLQFAFKNPSLLVTSTHHINSMDINNVSRVPRYVELLKTQKKTLQVAQSLKGQLPEKMATRDELIMGHMLCHLSDLQVEPRERVRIYPPIHCSVERSEKDHDQGPCP